MPVYNRNSHSGIAGKIYGKIVTDCDKRISDPIVDEEQGGFSKRGRVNQILGLWQVVENMPQ